MTFTDVKKKVRQWRPYLFEFWKRDLGTTWLPFEHEKIMEFSRVKPQENVSISGNVKWISERENIFALVPTPLSNQIYKICRNFTERRPTENSSIRVYGRTEWTNMTKISPSSTLFKGDQIINVYDWEDVKPEIILPKLNFEYQDFKKDLIYRIEGLEPQIVDFLAFTALSTPSFYENVGGINLTLYDSTAMGLPRLIMREMRRVIPPDIGELHTVTTPFGKFGLRYKYAFMTANADTPLTSTMENFLALRTFTFVKDYDELSLSLYSNQQKPKTIQDPPCNLSDIPTVAPEITAIDTTRRADPAFDSFKYMIIQHLKAPVFENYDKAIVDVVNHLEKLREEYDLDPAHLNRYGFLNASYSARPTSVLRKCLAYARAHDINIIKPEDVRRVINDFFDWNFGYVYEIWEDIIKKSKIPLSLRVEFREIWRIIRKYEDNFGSRGVSTEIIKAEAKNKPFETERLLKEMYDNGVIYEPTPRHFRTISG